MDIFTDHNFKDENKEYQDNTPNRGPLPNVFSVFARSLGIFSIFCAFFSIFFLSLLCGGLAIVLAVLSKGYEMKMDKNAKAGLLCGLIGVVFQISALFISAYNIIHIPEFREQFNAVYEQIYGAPVDDSINEILDKLGAPSKGGNLL